MDLGPSPCMDPMTLMEAAAMFEDEFTLDWLVELTGYKAHQILAEMQGGVDRNVLASQAPGIYSFRQPDRRQELTKGLAVQDKKLLHKRIADLLNRELPEDGEKSRLLACHLMEVDNDLEGCRVLCRAGDLHRQSFRTEQAFQCYHKVLVDLGRYRTRDADGLYVEAAIKYSKLSTARHDTTQVLKLLRQAKGRARKRDNLSCLVLLEMHIAKNEWLMADYDQALAHFQRGWSLVKTLDDPQLVDAVTAFGTFFFYWEGRFREAVDNYERTSEEVDAVPRSRFPLLGAITVGYSYATVGNYTQGIGMLDSIRTHCLERGDLYLASYAIGNIGEIMLDLRRLDEALQYLEMSAKMAEETDNRWVWMMLQVFLSFTYFSLGKKRLASKHLREFLAYREESRTAVVPYPYLLSLAWAVKQGELPAVKGLSLDREIKGMISSGNLYMRGIGALYEALNLERREAAPEKIIEAFEDAVRRLDAAGHRMALARARVEAARYLTKAGDLEKAGRLTDEAARAVSEMDEKLVPEDLRHLVCRDKGSGRLLEEILTLGKELVKIRDYRKLVQRIISTGNRVTGAERGAIFLVDPDAAGLVIRGSRNLTSAQIEEPGFSASMNLINEVAKTGKGRIMEKPSSQGTFPADSIRSRICVPMLLRNRVTGVLYHDNRLLSSAFKAPHLDLLSFFGAIAAIAIDNALAGNEIRRLNKKLNREKEYYQEEHIQSENFKEIIGKSRGIKKVLSQIEQVAGSNATVLITGETGVGKELVARAVHRLSPRKTNPFIRVHCSALPENLIPSELFGHEKGAFTGAAKRRTGRFELADSGSLFMDELGEINPDIQTRLLRVLQTREFERVGGTQTLKSDFRLIAATNKDLGQEVKAGRFRSDLFYRINVFPIHIPPLRERRKDIPLLAGHFLRIHSQRTGKEFIGIDKQDLAALMNYDWPGNIRELENVIERGCILSRGRHPRIPKLTPDIGLSQLAPQGGVTLRETEERHLRWALENTGWKVRGPGGAAQLLDINPSTLRFRMKKHDIRRPGS